MIKRDVPAQAALLGLSALFESLSVTTAWTASSSASAKFGCPEEQFLRLFVPIE